MLTAQELPARATATVLFPKNRGLAGQLESLRATYRETDITFDVRGEDVPYLASELASLGRRVVAFTGEDLLDEWLLAGNVLDERLVRRRIAWRDSRAIYGAPALCLIGSPESLLRNRPMRVAVCNRYRRLTERFLFALRASGIVLEAIAIEGSLETCVTSGVTDFIVDIVVTGGTIVRAGLQVLRVISTSDVAVLETLP